MLEVDVWHRQFGDSIFELVATVTTPHATLLRVLLHAVRSTHGNWADENRSNVRLIDDGFGRKWLTLRRRSTTIGDRLVVLKQMYEVHDICGCQHAFRTFEC